MSDPLRIELLSVLVSIEQELRRLDAWEGIPPAPERLASEVPFCHDTLEFTQWLQWIFIPRLRAVLEGGHALPSACAIAPIAEDALTLIDGETGPLFDHLLRIDRLITERG
ncbi:MAG: YqcC family protein [Pseudomonadota bacterium]